MVMVTPDFYTDTPMDCPAECPRIFLRTFFFADHSNSGKPYRMSVTRISSSLCIRLFQKHFNQKFKALQYISYV